MYLLDHRASEEAEEEHQEQEVQETEKWLIIPLWK